MASKASAKPLRVLETGEANFQSEWARICERVPEPFAQSAQEQAQAAIECVREDGEAGLRRCVEECEGVSLEGPLEVTREEWDEGCEALDPSDRAAIGKAAMRIREFHRKRMPSSWEMREEGGGYMGQRIRPLASVGVLAGADPNLHPCNVIMNVVPPSAVEVPEIVLAAACRADGTLRPEILTAARVAGVHRVFKMGGAHAVAALAYGIAGLDPVEKIVGSGGEQAAIAKRLLADRVAVSAEAGPGELCIVADRSATASWLAADLVSQAEREDGARTLLITHHKGLAGRVQTQIGRQLKGLSRTKKVRQTLAKGGVLVLARNIAESLELVDAYAPEHLVLAVENPEVRSKGIANAGSIALGHYTPLAVSDHLVGPNHVLPAAGRARFVSPLGVEDFLKRTLFMKLEPPKLRELGAEAIRLAELQDLSAHGASVELRLQKIRRVRREREAAREAEL